MRLSFAFGAISIYYSFAQAYVLLSNFQCSLIALWVIVKKWKFYCLRLRSPNKRRQKIYWYFPPDAHSHTLMILVFILTETFLEENFLFWRNWKQGKARRRATHIEPRENFPTTLCCCDWEKRKCCIQLQFSFSFFPFLAAEKRRLHTSENCARFHSVTRTGRWWTRMITAREEILRRSEGMGTEPAVVLLLCLF